MAKRKAIIDDGLNPELVVGARFAGIIEIPCIEAPEKIVIPKGMTPWTKRDRAPTDLELLEFFEKDFDFAEVLISPEGFIDEIKAFPAAVTLDCSQYRDAPFMAQLTNIYRSRAVGSYHQRQGANIYPFARWGDERTYTTAVLPEKVAFTGLPKHSVTVVSSYGCYQTAEDKFHFHSGLYSLIDELEPEVLLLHGSLAPDVAEKVSRLTELYQYPDWTTRVKGGPHHG